MKKYYLLLLMLISSHCFSCENEILNKKLSEGYSIVEQVDADLNGDSVRDKFVYLKRDRALIMFMILISNSQSSCALSESTPEIEWGGGGGCCYIDRIYAKNGSVFIQQNEKLGGSLSTIRYQFLYSKGDWRLAGYKIDEYFFPDNIENDIENKILDTNWLTGSRNTILKFTSGKSKTTTDKVAVEPILFKNFQMYIE